MVVLKEKVRKLLLSSQKLTKTDNVYIFKHGSFLMLGNIVNMGISFILSVAFARLLPKEVFGQYRYVLSLMTIFSISSLWGINDSIVQSVARGLEKTFNEGFKIKLKWSLIGSFASIIGSLYFFGQHNNGIAFSLLIVAVFMPIFKAGELFQALLDGRKLFDKRVVYTTIIQIISTLALISTMFISKNLIFLIFTYFFFYGMLRLGAYLLINKKFKPNANDDPQAIPYGKHLSVIKILTIASQEIDKFLVFNLLGGVQTAIYSFAVLPIEYIRSPLQSLQQLALPKLSVGNENDTKKTLPKKLVMISALILVGILIYYILAPYFYEILYPQYLSSVPYSRLFSLSLLVFPISMMMLALQAKNRTKELYKSNLVQSVSQIILAIILTPLWGITGIIMARLLSYVFYFFSTWFFFKK